MREKNPIKNSEERQGRWKKKILKKDKPKKFKRNEKKT